VSSIRIVTEVPGPISRALKERAALTVARPLGPHDGVFIAEGEGACVTDVDGNRFLDFIAGVGCLAVGHSHPLVVKAIDEQMRSFTHTDFSIVGYEVYVSFVERLAQACGGDRKIALFDTGAEAVENAVKIARTATGRSGIVCFEGAFHGRSFMDMSLTHREDPYKRGFGPFASDVHRAPYPNLGGAGLEESLEAVGSMMRSDEIAAVIVEPVLGEGGFVVPPEGFLKGLQSLCRESGAVLIADEVQTGYGRCGSFLASDTFAVRPDLVLLGKSIAAGLPLSAVVGEPSLMDAPSPNALGGTFPGNPVACASALAVLDVFEGEGLVGRAEAIGDLLIGGWRRLADRHGGIREVRGVGAMVGVEFEEGSACGRVIEEALRRGLMLLSAGAEGRVLRHLLPLITSDDQVAEAMEVLEESVKAA
jgi:4-aminobutyrate aminotransferase/(S)-3-amino-2-methylpropionate transaminase